MGFYCSFHVDLRIPSSLSLSPKDLGYKMCVISQHRGIDVHGCSCQFSLHCGARKYFTEILLEIKGELIEYIL